MGYANPLLDLPATKKVLALPRNVREPLEALMRELRADADRLAEQSWKKRKGPMAAYWRAVSTYARHVAHALSKGADSAVAPAAVAREDQMRQALCLCVEALERALKHHGTTSLPLAVQNYGSPAAVAEEGRKVWRKLVPDAISQARSLLEPPSAS